MAVWYRVSTILAATSTGRSWPTSVRDIPRTLKRRAVGRSAAHGISAALQCDARLLRAKSEEVRSGSGGFSLGLQLLALRFEPMVDQALRRV